MGRAGCNNDSVLDGFRILISRVGRHALASPKVEGLVLLVLINYYALAHLAYRQLNTVTKHSGVPHRDCPIGYGPMGYGNARKDNNTIDLLFKQ